MKRFAKTFTLSACVAAASVLISACGGGSDDPVPGTDTMPPVVLITDNVSAATATGPVTFTFTFSEDVGTSFAAEDIMVTGGTAGVFERISGTVATIVVTPVADAAGTIAVSVAAAKYEDLASNKNTAAASASQDYNTLTTHPPAATNLVANGNFSNGVTGWSGNALDVRTEGGNSFNYANVATAGEPFAVNLSYVLNIPNSGVGYKLRFKASSNRARTMLAGIGLNQDPWTNVTKPVNLTTTQQTFELSLSSNFASATSRVIFDMGADTGVVVIDDVELVLDTATAPAGGPTAAASLPTASAANVKSIFSDSYTNVAVDEWGPDWGPASARITDGVIAGNNYKTVDMSAAGQEFAGISFVSSKFNATAYTTFHMDYWVDTPLPAGQVINIKLSNHDGSGETSAIQYLVNPVTGGSWQRLSIPLSSFTVAGGGSASRNNIAQIIITAARANTAQPVKVYFDNMYFSQAGTTPPPVATNLVTNGDFSSGVTGWSGNARNVLTEGGNSFNFANVAVAGNAFDVNLSYVLNIPNSGVGYKLRFKASSDRSRTMVAGIGLNQAPFDSATQLVNLTTTQQAFELSLTSNFASATSRVIFDMGAAVGTVVIDDVELVLDTPTAPAGGPTAAASDPTASALNVKSIFSDSYTNVTVDQWGPDWGESSARITDGVVAGNNYKTIDMSAGKVFAGISFVSSKFNATAYTTFHMDYWIDTPIPVGQVLSIKLSNHDGPNGETSAIQTTVTNITGGGWQRLSIPLSSFTVAGGGSSSRNNIAQIIITAARADTGLPVKVYFDNMYFSQ